MSFHSTLSYIHNDVINIRICQAIEYLGDIPIDVTSKRKRYWILNLMTKHMPPINGFDLKDIQRSHRMKGQHYTRGLIFQPFYSPRYFKLISLFQAEGVKWGEYQQETDIIWNQCDVLCWVYRQLCDGHITKFSLCQFRFTFIFLRYTTSHR